MARTTGAVLSSLPLEIMLYFNNWYAWLYFFLNIVLFIYKGNAFLYPSGALEWELAFVFMYRIIEYLRTFQASRANKTETIVPMIWSFVLAVSMIILNIYYLREQTYVLRMDIVLNAISLAFISLEVLIGLATVFSFYKEW